MKNMQSQLRGRAMPLLVLAALCAQPSSSSFAQQPSAPATIPACAFPTALTGSREETAWKIFAAAMCPVANGPLTFETWTEQHCFQNPGAPGCSANSLLSTTATNARALHGSVLRRAITMKQRKLTTQNQGGLSDDCAPMTTRSSGSPLNPFVPKNLASGAKFCEEVFVNQAEASFVNNPPGAAPAVNLRTNTGQAAYISSNGTLSFPVAALEIKVDWLPADAVKPNFTCTGPNKPTGVYTETIDKKCYAMVGLHISSKLAPNWLWATFEPQNTVTNPNRCNPKLYSGCNDAWGSSPPRSTGAPTGVTEQLKNLITAANIAPEFLNYRLVGIQTEVTDAPLGNSFVEFNAGVNPGQASCITCHSYAAINTATKPPGQGSGGGTPPTGKPSPLPPGWVALDFSWMLGFMPPGK